MLATRFSFFLAQMALTASLFFGLPLVAQVQGVPAMEFHGVPSSGIGGASAAFSAARSKSGRPGASAAFACCASFFFPSSFSPIVPYPAVATGHRKHHGHRRHRDEVVGVAEPVYVPYAIPYAVDSNDYAEDQDDGGIAESAAGGEESSRLSATRAGRAGRPEVSTTGAPEYPEQKAGGNLGYDTVVDSEISAQEAPPDPPEPVVAQPKTVLVFKDGHRSEVVNYAIVGDTLFDFSGDRMHKILIADLDISATTKANDASGVEFKLPPPGKTAVR